MSPFAARRRRVRRLAPAAIAGALVAGLLAQPPAAAYNSVTLAGGDRWMLNDAGAPGVDTGSIRQTTAGALQGYGGIRMDVANAESPLNGILLRGFGLAYDGVDSFTSARSVELDGVAVKREVKIATAAGYGRFFDTFTNTTSHDVRVDVAFGGQLGYDTGANQSAIAGTSSGDGTITSADGWASWYTPSAGPGSASHNGPSATTTGTPGYAGSLHRMGNFLRDPFANPMAADGDEANHPGFVNRLLLAPGESRSVAHFVVSGLSERRAAPDGSGTPAAGSQVDAVEARAAQLTATPDLAGLSVGEICSLANYDLAALPGFDESRCAATAGEPLPGSVGPTYTPPVIETSSPYDVVGKTITELRADMAAGRTTAEQVTRAYLDRIAAYDRGPLGLRSVIAVAPDAMAQARAMDRARATGDDRPLLGIPILVKDIVDTKDMPTTGGSFVFDGYRPTKDAWQVAKLREAGALILGKANLAEFANDGHYSASAYGKVWNAFDPSRSAIGSSGGSGTAVASSFAAAAIGTQTGDSLWGPSGAMSLYTMRGTDGMQSGDGTMPLNAIQDYVGFMTTSLPDLALLLEAAAVGNPDDPLDDMADGRRPAAWTPSLDANALRGKVIGIPAGAFDDPFQTTSMSEAMEEQLTHFEAAGATLKPIAAAPAAPASVPGDTGYEGWRRWIAAHPDNPYDTPEQITRSPLRLADRRNTTPYTGTGPMSASELTAALDRRAAYKELLAGWMDDEGVDVVLYPTQLSEVHLNDSVGNSFGRLDPQSSASGVPTVVVPAGLNENGHPIGFQLQGKAFQDAELMGMAYAFDQRAQGHVVPVATTPPLVYDAGAIPTPVPPVTPIPPTTPNPPAAKRQLTVLKRTSVPTRKGRFPVEIGCASGAGACTGRVVVRTGGAVVGTKTVTVRPGLSRVLWFNPKKAVKTRLRNGRPVKVRVFRAGTGATVTSDPVVVTVKRRR